jgi:hypothetical protein
VKSPIAQARRGVEEQVRLLHRAASTACPAAARSTSSRISLALW